MSWCQCFFTQTKSDDGKMRTTCADQLTICSRGTGIQFFSPADNVRMISSAICAPRCILTLICKKYLLPVIHFARLILNHVLKKGVQSGSANIKKCKIHHSPSVKCNPVYC
uniref:Uncharacterized protein n=1 Tax=Ciona intestinalis TaxID=7719 RepID=H2XYN7_CIOIN